MSFKWTYIPWGQPAEQDDLEDLKANETLTTLPGSPSAFTWQGAAAYADSSYLACRILMLASMKLHPEALYFAGQVLEKYMKAIISQREGPRFDPKKLRHCLLEIARKAGHYQPEFLDPEFLELCNRLHDFEVAGRYPDHRLNSWSYSLQLLTFLDGFVIHCRELLAETSPFGWVPWADDAIREIPYVDQHSNPVQIGAAIAILDRNRRIEELTGYEPAHVARLRTMLQAWGGEATSSASPEDDGKEPRSG